MLAFTEGWNRKAAFVRAKGAVELESKSPVDVDVAPVIMPRDTEHDLSFGFNDPIKDLCLDVLRMLFQYRPQRIKDFSHRLVELDLPGIAFEDLFVNTLDNRAC